MLQPLNEFLSDQTHPTVYLSLETSLLPTFLTDTQLRSSTYGPLNTTTKKMETHENL